ncbi:MAG: alkyl hydroperoxide reductase [Chloroflexi bacterium]|nr:alkyl hydroperoxide reductase [Chloroflexota bacterium]|tara:strand:+ start:2545 stop:2841 length:297 start_codon:yes stop_codon:yes gene_type:complete
MLPEFQEIDTQVLGISTDPSPSQKAFSISLGNINYPLLSDFHPKGKISKIYKVYDYNKGTSKRSILLINKNGIIKFKRIYSDISEFKINTIFNELNKI